MKRASDMIGEGIYSLHEAARLLRVPARTASRWTKGYTARGVDHAPLRTPSHPAIAEEIALSFADIMELRVVAEFRKAGVSLQAIRRAADEIRKLKAWSHALALKQVCTDGRRLFAKIAADSKDPQLVELAPGQQGQLYDVVLPSLTRSVDYDKDGRPISWRPDRDYAHVVIDPKIAFGKPIIKDTRIETSTLAAAYKAAKSTLEVAEDFNVSPAIVKEAALFESKFAA